MCRPSTVDFAARSYVRSIVVKMLHKSNHPRGAAAFDPSPSPTAATHGGGGGGGGSSSRGRAFVSRVDRQASGGWRGVTGPGQGNGWGARDRAGDDGALSGLSDGFTGSSDDSASPTGVARRGDVRRGARGEGLGSGDAACNGGFEADDGETACDIFLEAVATGGMEEELLEARSVAVRETPRVCHRTC